MTSNMGDSTSTYSTYGQQAHQVQTPMPPGMQPGYEVRREQHTGPNLRRPGWLTSELIAYVATVLGVLIAALAIGDGGDNRGPDNFGAAQAWTLITVLTFGYMLAKGIAKAGKSSHQYDENSRF